MVELSTVVIFLAIFLSVPIQFYLSPRTTSDIQYYLQRLFHELKEVFNNFLDNILDLDGVEVDSSAEGDGEETETVHEETLKKDGMKNLFGGSDEPRHPRPPLIKYRVGQVIRHSIHNYRGVIVAWDERAKAPGWWIKKVHGKERIDEPNYMVLIDTRDRLVPQIAYVVEGNIVLSRGQVIHPLVRHYFESFDGLCYKSRPWHKRIYPND